MTFCLGVGIFLFPLFYMMTSLHLHRNDFSTLVIIMPLSPLQNFIRPENIKKTKMGLENISMVWAPNFLRCPSDDHTLIFQNTRMEMAFLRLLLKHLDLDKTPPTSSP